MANAQITQAIDNIRKFSPQMADRVDEYLQELEPNCLKIVEICSESKTNGIYEVTMARAGGKEALESLYDNCLQISNHPFDTYNTLDTERLNISSALILTGKMLKSSIQLPNGDALENQPLFALDSFFITFSPNLLGMIVKLRTGEVNPKEIANMLFSLGAGALIKEVSEMIAFQHQMEALQKSEQPGEVVDFQNLIQ